jgi:hypothetical protein
MYIPNTLFSFVVCAQYVQQEELFRRRERAKDMYIGAHRNI